MKYVRRILYFILALFIIACGVIAVCALNPGLSGQIADFFHISAFTEEEETDEDVLLADEDDVVIEETETGEIVYVPVTSVGSTVSGSSTGSSTGVGTGAVSSDGSIYDTDSATDDWADDDDEDWSLSGITAPSAVSDKNGYQPVEDERTRIDASEAEDLKAEIGYGSTGDGLTFNSTYYPYYAMLDSAGQHVYRQIYANANALTDTFAPIEDLTVSEIKQVFEAVYDDHPELFWLDTAYSCQYTGNGTCAAVTLQFNAAADNVALAQSALDTQADAIIQDTAQLDSDYEKEKYVHDALIEKVTYADGADMNQSAYSALVNGTSVCAGYARAFQYILQKMEIPCYYCTGYSGENHAWNIVSLDDGYYNVDVTWDDTSPATYDYFNKTDGDYSSTHLRTGLSVNLPACLGVRYRNLESSTGTGTTGTTTDTTTGTTTSTSGVRRSLSDTGHTADEALKNLSSYYNNCYAMLTNAGKGSYTFENVLAGKSLYQKVYNAYQNNAYRAGYMNAVLSKLGATYYTIQWNIEYLEDDYYLVTHTVEIW